MQTSFDDSDSDQAVEKPFGGKEGTLFVIDCRQSMFGAIDGEQTPFKLAVNCVRNAIANIAISCSSDEVAVILLGTEKTQNSYDFKHIFVLQPLKQASADLVLLFDDNLSRADENLFRNEYGLSENYSFGELFWLCNGIFSKEKKKYYGKSVMLFTNEDDPYKDDKVKRNQSVIRASDLVSNHVEIHIIPMCSEFDFRKYYNEITTHPQFDNKRDFKREHLMNRIRMKSYKQRTFATVPFVLGSGVKLSVAVYVLVRETKKPFSIKLDRHTNAQLTSETKYITDSDDIVDKSHLLKSVEYGAMKVCFDSEEMKDFKNHEPNLTLLGFKPVEYLQAHYHKTPSYFIIPNESTVKGSNCLFNALIQQCIRRRVVAICRGVFRRTSGISLIALVPQVEEENLKPGFHAVILPFSEDIRDLNLKAASPVDVDSQLIDTTKDIIKSLKRDYDPVMIKNPALQKFYANIEALALRLDAAEPVNDDLKPDVDVIEKKIGEYRDMFNFHLPKSVMNETDVKNDLLSSIDDLRHAAKFDKLGKYTVKQLSEFCSAKDIKCGKKKADIIDAIKAFYRSNSS